MSEREEIYKALLEAAGYQRLEEIRDIEHARRIGTEAMNRTEALRDRFWVPVKKGSGNPPESDGKAEQNESLSKGE